MGRDIAGEREMRRTHGRRVSGLDEALVVEGEQRRLLLLGQTITRTTDEANLFIPCMPTAESGVNDYAYESRTAVALDTRIST